METGTNLLTDIPENDVLRYPSLLTRIQSIFVDGILIILLMFLAGKILDQFETVPDWIRIVLFVSLWGVYEPLAMSFGCTVGNYLLGIRVKQYNHQTKRINILQAYLRFAVKFCLGWLSFIAIHFNSDKRAIHDLASGSIMIKLQK
jgi:uncharacterized RDD family membrane protein YckC